MFEKFGSGLKHALEWLVHGNETHPGAFFKIPCAECQTPVRSIFMAVPGPKSASGSVIQHAFCDDACRGKYWSKTRARRADGDGGAAPGVGSVPLAPPHSG